MSKKNRSSERFSSAKNEQTPQKLRPHNTVGNKAKEQKALILIQKGRRNEAELIFKELVAAGSQSHITHGTLGALLQMKGDLQNAILYFNSALQLKPNYPQAHFNLGIALHEQGDLIAAIASYNSALQFKPNYPQAHNNLGNAHKKQGDLTAAIASYNSALQLKPNYPEALYNLGIALQEQGDLNAAITSINSALQLKPNYPEALYNLGIALQKQGDLTAAIASYNSALQLKPNYPDALNNLGNNLRDKGDLTAAIASYNSALQLKPNYPEALYNLGIALQEQGDLNAAITSFNSALQLKPNYPDALNNLGIALQEQGQLDEALINHKRALDLNPDNSNAFYGMGLVQAGKGNLKDSKNSFKQSLELDPNNTSAIFGLSKNIQSEEDLQELAKKLDGITRTELNTRQDAMLEFATANFHHKSKNYKNATRHLARANALKLSFYPSDLSNHLLLTKRSAALASQISAGNTSDGNGNIFIVGVPRCGSTLLESVLSTDSSIRDLGETKALSQALTHIIRKIRTKEAAPSLSDAYAEKIKETRTKHTFNVDKNLYNFRLTEAIARAMPSARIIHCRRHPLDNILSMLRSNLKPGHSYTSDPLDAAKFLIHQEEIMRKFKGKYASHIFNFDYDTFVTNPEKEIRPLLNWLGLKWDESYLYPELNNRSIITASVIQARRPINSKSVGGWKNYRDILKPAEDALKESGIFNL